MLRMKNTRINSMLKSGFTLIELIVVIAIISILAAVILTSLGSARSKANDSKIKQQLRNARTAMELYFTNNNFAYTASSPNMAAPALPCTGTMFVDAATRALDITGTAAAWPTGTSLSCQATAGGYAISATLSNGQFWCMDSTGLFQQNAAQQAQNDITCN